MTCTFRKPVSTFEEGVLQERFREFALLLSRIRENSIRKERNLIEHHRIRSPAIVHCHQEALLSTKTHRILWHFVKRRNQNRETSHLSSSYFTEPHFLLTALPILSNSAGIESLSQKIFPINTESPSYSMDSGYKGSEYLTTAQKYYLKALTARSSEYTSLENQKRQTRLSVISRLVQGNYESMLRFSINWLKLDTSKALASLRGSYFLSTCAMNLFWYHFWRGDMIDPDVLLCTTSYKYQEHFSQFSDAFKVSPREPREPTPYSVAPESHEIFDSQNLPFSGSSVAFRIRLNYHTVCRLNQCESGIQVPEKFSTAIVISEYYEKCHAVLSQSSCAVSLGWYGVCSRVKNVWRFMLEKAFSLGPSQPSAALHTLMSLPIIERNSQRASEIQRTSTKAGALEALQRRIRLKISTMQEKLLPEARLADESGGIVPQRICVELFISLSKHILQDGKISSDTRPVNLSMLFRGRPQDLTLLSELRSFLDAFVNCILKKRVSQKVDFSDIKRCVEYFLRDDNLNKVKGPQATACSSDALFPQENAALWYGMQAARLLYEKVRGTILATQRQKKRNTQNTHHELVWEAVGVLFRALRFPPIQSFIVFCIQLTCDDGSFKFRGEKQKSTHFFTCALRFLEKQLRRSGTYVFFQSLCMVIYVATRASPLLSRSPKTSSLSSTERFVLSEVSRIVLRSPTKRKSPSSISGIDSAYFAPFALIVNPVAVKTLYANGFSAAALKMQHVLLSGYGKKIHDIVLRAAEFRVPVTRVSNGHLAVMLVHSRSPMQWSTAATFLHQPREVVRRLQTVTVHGGESIIVEYVRAYNFVCQRLCEARRYSTLIALIQPRDGVRAVLDASTIHRIAHSLLLNRNDWLRALHVMQVLVHFREETCCFTQRKFHREASISVLRSYNRCTTWVDVLGVAQKKYLPSQKLAD